MQRCRILSLSLPSFLKNFFCANVYLYSHTPFLHLLSVFYLFPMFSGIYCIFGWLVVLRLNVPTIFQSCRDGAIASWVINQYFRGVKCLAQGHNTAAVGLEPRTSRSGVRHSTTEPPRSPYILQQKILRAKRQAESYCIIIQYLSQLLRLWYLSHRGPAKAQARCAVLPEPSLFAHMKYGSRRRVRPKIRHLAYLDGCASRLKNEFTEDKIINAIISWNGSFCHVFDLQVLIM